MEFDKDNMSDRVLKRIGQYCAQPDFMPDIIGKVVDKICFSDCCLFVCGTGMCHPGDPFF